jgi:NAD(P)-dependent dehydrogenase (short-subunit alcohol dehydrogenase family)
MSYATTPISGATVNVADINPAHVEGIASAIVAAGGKAPAVADQVKAMVDFAVQKTGALHGIVNNAGIGGPWLSPASR